MSAHDKIRLIAFYLPQFHPTPYNDEWWGKGFTEWTNVVRARPRFRGHYQPHLPADLGFYDLRLPETREAQASLACEYGIYGFCYYHYWFEGRQFLDLPLNGVLASGKPDFPFCVCWANENWTRTWDGFSRQVLLEQHYSSEDDLAHIHQLIPVLGDSRYIRIEGKALLLVYRVGLLPDPRNTAELWRNEARKAGVGELFLVNVQTSHTREVTDPVSVGFDAAVRFQPYFQGVSPRNKLIAGFRRLRHSPVRGDEVMSYRKVYTSWRRSPAPPYRHFHCVAPGWDNSARRAKKAWMIQDPSPELYQKWLQEIVERTEPDGDGVKWIFVNAWNEWAEGCHLEPCQKWGRAYLEATKRAVEAND